MRFSQLFVCRCKDLRTLQVFVGVDMARRCRLLRFVCLLLTRGFGDILILRKQIWVKGQRRQQTEEDCSWPQQAHAPNWKMQRHQTIALQGRPGGPAGYFGESDVELCRVQ